MTRYEYLDHNGRLRYTVVRHEPKGFRIEAPDGSELGDPLPENLRLLYRLPEVLMAPKSTTVYVAERVKDAETLAAHGFLATTMPCGTRGGWLSTFDDCLHGSHVVILPDADGPGRRHAKAVCQSLAGKAASVVVVDLHRSKSGPWDVTDWFNRAGDDAAVVFRQVVERRRMEAWKADSERTVAIKGRDQKSAILWTCPLTSTQKLVMLCVRSHAKVIDALTAGEIARECGLHRVTVQKSLGDLRRLGALDGMRPNWEIMAAMACDPLHYIRSDSDQMAKRRNRRRRRR